MKSGDLAEHGAHRVAVIGAGIAGLAAARALHDRGFAVQVLERGRGVGGRTAQRRRDTHCFDHGAQYFTARDARFVACVETWLAVGVVAPWRGRVVSIDARGAAAPVAPCERFVGIPGMNAMAKHLARGVDVVTQCAVTELIQDARGWRLTGSGNEVLGPFDSLVLAMPPEQIARLAAPDELLAAACAPPLLPCWCAMVAFDAPLAAAFNAAFVDRAVNLEGSGNGDPRDASALAWVARDSSKPQRPEGERWVIHATAQWSAQRLAEPPDSIARELLEHFFSTLGVSPREPAYLAGHRWSFARPTGEGAADCVWIARHRVALCGDWCRGGRVEGAFLSGVAAAGRIQGAGLN